MIDFRGHTGLADAASASIHGAVPEATSGAASAIAIMPGMVASLAPARAKPALSAKFSNVIETAGARPRAGIDRARRLGRGARLSLMARNMHRMFAMPVEPPSQGANADETKRP
jgi:hypothetical protein